MGRSTRFSGAAGCRRPAVQDLSHSQGITIGLIPTGDLVAALRREHGDLYFPLTIPAGVYPDVQSPVAVVGVANVLVVNEAMPEALAYDITRVLFEKTAAAGANSSRGAQSVSRDSAEGITCRVPSRCASLLSRAVASQNFKIGTVPPSGLRHLADSSSTLKPPAFPPLVSRVRRRKLFAHQFEKGGSHETRSTSSSSRGSRHWLYWHFRKRRRRRCRRCRLQPGTGVLPATVACFRDHPRCDRQSGTSCTLPAPGRASHRTPSRRTTARTVSRASSSRTIHAGPVRRTRSRIWWMAATARHSDSTSGACSWPCRTLSPSRRSTRPWRPGLISSATDRTLRRFRTLVMDPDWLDNLFAGTPLNPAVPYADAVHAGWMPGTFFDRIRPNGGSFLLGFTVSFNFLNPDGTLSDIDRDGKPTPDGVRSTTTAISFGEREAIRSMTTFKPWRSTNPVMPSGLGTSAR